MKNYANSANATLLNLTGAEKNIKYKYKENYEILKEDCGKAES